MSHLNRLGIHLENNNILIFSEIHISYYPYYNTGLELTLTVAREKCYQNSSIEILIGLLSKSYTV